MKNKYSSAELKETVERELHNLIEAMSGKFEYVMHFPPAVKLELELVFPYVAHKLQTSDDTSSLRELLLRLRRTVMKFDVVLAR